jgi:predicted  nucleic acid-binding Zn-ribbon protein
MHTANLPGESVADEQGLDLRFLYRPVVFMEPERAVHPVSWLDYTPFAFWIVDALRPSVFVELGCHSGNSYASFAQAVQTIGLTTACYGVDTWRGDPHAGFFDETVFEEWSAYHNRRFSAFSRLIRATFDDARDHFTDGSIDLIHLDGYHTFEAALHDFESWLPKLSARGVVLFHDINVREADFGAWRLWEHLSQDYPSFEFLHGHGLGVLGTGQDFPDAVHWLLSLRRGEAERVNRVRTFFSRLGAAVVGRFAAEQSTQALRVELAARDSQLAAASGDAERHAHEATALTERLTQATADVDRLNLDLASANAQIAETKQQLADTRQQLADTRQQLADTKQQFADTMQQLADTKQQFADTNQQLADTKQQFADTNQQLADVHQQRDVIRVQAEDLGERLRAGERLLAKRTTQARSLLASAKKKRVELGRRSRQVETLTAKIAALQLRVHDLATGLDDRAAQIVRLSRDLAQVPRALRARDERIAALDGDACEALEALQRETSARNDETTRRQSLEALLTWSQAQVSVMAKGANRSTRTLAKARSGLLPPSRTSLPRAYRSRMSPAQQRDFKLIAASRLFDLAYYRNANPDVAAKGGSPLVHYVLVGAAQRRDPHPLFSTAYYATKVTDLRPHANALVHYLTHGWRTGCSPHPLFDPAHYLAQDANAAREGVDPLQHYLEHGVAAHRSPHPLFDVAFYLREHPEVRAAGIEPLAHFLQHGPGPHAPAVLKSDRPIARVSGHRTPLAMRSLEPRETRPTIVMVSHVGPWQPKAGNQYRVARMLRWYQRKGYRIIPVIAPLPDDEIPRHGVEAIADEFGNAVQCQRDGRVDYILRNVPPSLASLDRCLTRSLGDLLWEDRSPANPRQRQLLQMERTFCHDVVASTVLHLGRTLGPHILQVEYIWMTRMLPLVRGDVLKVVDTIDVFSSIQQKVSAFGLDDVVIEAQEEAERLRRTDLVIAIQNTERAALERLAPSVPVITAGVDFEVVADTGVPDSHRILYVGSNNPRNRKGLDDFLRLAWPLVRRQLPQAELLVAGSVSEIVTAREIPGVSAIGPVDDVTPLYRHAAIVINPAVAGTGIKIKTLEALCHARQVVTWPNGVEGLDPSLAQLCVVAHDWYEFSEQLVHALSASGAHAIDAGARSLIARHVSPEYVYASLDEAFGAFFERTLAVDDARD